MVEKREEHDAEMICGEEATGEQGQADDEKKTGEREGQVGDDPKVSVEGAEGSKEKKPWDGQGIEIAIGEADSQWGHMSSRS